jgi:hypothetical protein
MPLDRGTRIYAGFLLAVVVGLVALALYQPAKVRELNQRLANDPLVSGFPYPFHVLRVENGVAVMSTPRSSLVPVAEVLGRLFPEVANASPDSPQFQEHQSQLAKVQKHAKALVLQDPDIHDVRWELDRDWLLQHGIQPGQ